MATVKYTRKMTRKDKNAKAKVKTTTNVMSGNGKTSASFSKSVVPYTGKETLSSSHFHVRISQIG